MITAMTFADVVKLSEWAALIGALAAVVVLVIVWVEMDPDAHRTPDEEGWK